MTGQSHPPPPRRPVATGTKEPTETEKAVNAEFLALLAEARQGSAAATEQLAQLVLKHLKNIARAKMARKFGRQLAGVTIQPTLVANDTFLKMLRQRNDFEGLDHFFALATTMVWRRLLDHQRRRESRRPRDGGILVSLDVDPVAPAEEQGCVEVEALHAALEELGRLKPRLKQTFELRKIWGLTILEAAKTMGTSPATVSRDLEFAVAWLRRRLSGSAIDQGE